MLTLKDLDHSDGLDRKKMETIKGGVNYALVQAYYSSDKSKEPTEEPTLGRTSTGNTLVAYTSRYYGGFHQ